MASPSMQLPPLSLYVHIPWCAKKCPYCDFNSHTTNQALPVDAYITHLIQDLSQDLAWIQGRKINSIFFGGGTPSLFPAEAIEAFLLAAQKHLDFSDNIEITLEVNPGTSEYSNFHILKAAGVNRLSFGAQSFDDAQLKTLGRIHSHQEIFSAIEKAREASFTNINIDLMHSLPNQSVDAALYDLEQAIALKPAHISWYQLTIEANTAFYSAPPSLPNEDIQEDILTHGLKLLEDNDFQQYEVSAFSPAGKQCLHNMNYWEFGDYLAIGAGAHGKITLPDLDHYVRFDKKRIPSDYMNDAQDYINRKNIMDEKERGMEFLLNALRLRKGVKKTYFEQRTGLSYDTIATKIGDLQKLGLMDIDPQFIATTNLGFQYLNSVLERLS